MHLAELSALSTRKHSQRKADDVRRYLSASVDSRRRLGASVRRVTLDPEPYGSGCPNRGPDSQGGCVFCNPAGSGSGAFARGLSVPEQWDSALARMRPPKKSSPAPLLMAYVQSYTATYGPPERLANLLDILSGLPGVSLASVGARPDCLEPQTLALLENFRHTLATGELWLDMGLQSADDETLARIGRGHTFGQFTDACARAHASGLRVCVHVMAGLPGEQPENLIQTIRAICTLPIDGIKLHNCLVVHGARLEQLWRAGHYAPLELEAYADMVVRALELLPSRVSVHRLQADPAPGELLAPDWARNKHAVLEAIRARLAQTGTWQAKLADAPQAPPVLYGPPAPSHQQP